MCVCVCVLYIICNRLSYYNMSCTSIVCLFSCSYCTY